MIGPRVEFVNAFEGKAESSGSVTIPLLGTVTETITDKYGVSLIPIMLGISYDASFPMVPISVKGGIYGGYGIATAYSDLSASEAGISAPAENETMSGSGFVGEILLSGDYSFAPFFSLGLNVGYRIANISQMKYTADVPDLSITKNSVVKDINQNTLPFDYSGLMVGLALNFGF